jgi:hypothetical protein
MRNFKVLKLLCQAAIGTSLLAAAMIVTPVPRAQADEDCQRRLVRTDHKLHEAIEKHGYESRQADHWRHELREARQWCWDHGHRWWSEDEHRWHSDRDWDDRDHDRH